MTRRQRATAALMGLVATAVMGPAPAWAQSKDAPPSADAEFSRIIGNLRLWLVGLLAVGATLMLTVAGWLYLTAGGNPTQIERAKTAFRSAMVGYAVAALAPILVGVLQGLTK